MATPRQIEANRQNAQSSAGAKTEAGKQRSSLNAVTHGFTGQSLVLSSTEKEAYEFHILAYMDHYAPKSHIETNLVQQYADLVWSLHQINVQQANLMSLINAITEKVMKEGDLNALPNSLSQPYKTLNTLGIYENRRRRAANLLLEQLNAVLEARREALAQAAKAYKHSKSQGKPFVPSEFGFVHSVEEIERFLARANSPACDNLGSAHELDSTHPDSAGRDSRCSVSR
jgi:hypothetical protein